LSQQAKQLFEMAGTFNFTITAAGGGLCPGGRDYALVIACRTINVTPANPNLPPGSVGAPFTDSNGRFGRRPYQIAVN
jgi:hypothetical protein